MGLDDRPIVWDATNTKHIERDHHERGIVRSEVDEALRDVRRVEAIETRERVDYHVVVGSTHAGRLLVVAWVDHPEGRFPVHARRAGRQAARRYYR